VLVLGLDGATLDVINPLIAAGRLPNLARLRAEGVSAPLRSTEPDTTALAWTSCRTGVNPGKHGIFSFWRVVNYEWIFNNSLDIKVPAVEHILSRQGLRVCTVNVPITYPPQAVNGYVISGLPTPGPESGFTYPLGLQAGLIAQVGDFDPDGYGDLNFSQPTQALQYLYGRHRRRREITRRLLAQEPWDYFMVVFTLADKIQHGFWRARELWQAGDPRPLIQRFGPVIDQCYELLDETVGQLLAECGDETRVLVVSDHGFGSCKNEVYPNTWLRQMGYMRLKPFHKVQARQVRWERRAGLPVPRLVIGAPGRRVAWNKTSAFGSLYVESRSLRLNLKGRYPQGFVTPGQQTEKLMQSLADGLLSLKMPDGKPVFQSVIPPSELYHGPYASQAADLQMRTADPSTRILGKFTVNELIYPLDDPRASTGNHRPLGILFARGPGVQARSLPEIPSIMDIAPTALRWLDQPVPGYMDGAPLFE
jgi:predicted AlkP superfamily phosphohydrolase/phosphomutase